MNKGTVGILSFIAGVAVGAVVVGRVLKAKYEQIAQEEIDSVKETFAERAKEEFGDESEKTEKKPVVDTDKPTLAEYAAKLEEEGYINNTETKKKKGGTKNVKKKKPCVISPDEFDEYAENDNYELVSLNYYADGVLANDYDEIIDDVDGTVGAGSLETFGEYEEDSVFVRNDALKTIYEICRDTRKYSDVVKESYPMED